MVCHNYPPAHSAGTETYTAELARRLVLAGHGVRVFTTEKDVGRRDLSVHEREHRGVPVTELVNNLFHRDFRETWDHPGIAARFGEELDRRRPDLVHFQHLLYLSVGCVEEAARRGLPVVFTLHDFWLQCPRFGQRVHADGGRCDTIDFERCGTCMARFKYAQSGLQRRTGRALARLRDATGIDLGPAARRLARALEAGRGAPGAGREGAEGSELGQHPGVADLNAGPSAAALAEAVRERDRAMRERVVPCVHRFVSPSRFLRDELVRWGVPPERIEHLPTGIDLEAFPRAPRRPRAPGQLLQVGFIGSLVPLKGPAVLLEAWSRLPPACASAARLSLRGPGHHHPEFQAALARRAAELGAELGGPLARHEVPAALAALDLLVVPSLWFENAPLILLEARAVGTPVVVSGLGGMAELVTDGVDGRHVRTGDTDDLARVLGELIADPAALEALRHGPPVPRVERDVERMQALYAEVLAEVAGRAGSQPAGGAGA